MTISGEFIAFLGLAIAAIAGGVLMLNLTKVVHMVVSLVFTFISLAGIYVMLSAEFVAAVQILIYSGAITIIMLFGIMLTRHNDHPKHPVLAGSCLLGQGLSGLPLSCTWGFITSTSGQSQQQIHTSTTPSK